MRKELDFEHIYGRVRDYVKERGGWLDTSDRTKGDMFAMKMDPDALEMYCERINAVRLVDDGLQVYCGDTSAMDEDLWSDIRTDAYIYFEHTLLSMALNIEEYGKEI